MAKTGKAKITHTCTQKNTSLLIHPNYNKESIFVIKFQQFFLTNYTNNGLINIAKAKE